MNIINNIHYNTFTTNSPKFSLLSTTINNSYINSIESDTRKLASLSIVRDASLRVSRTINDEIDENLEVKICLVGDNENLEGKTNVIDNDETTEIDSIRQTNNCFLDRSLQKGFILGFSRYQRAFIKRQMLRLNYKKSLGHITKVSFNDIANYLSIVPNIRYKFMNSLSAVKYFCTDTDLNNLIDILLNGHIDSAFQFIHNKIITSHII